MQVVSRLSEVCVLTFTFKVAFNFISFKKTNR
jgi:hypothetical protein